jgi:hypothetical protein
LTWINWPRDMKEDGRKAYDRCWHCLLLGTSGRMRSSLVSRLGGGGWSRLFSHPMNAIGHLTDSSPNFPWFWIGICAQSSNMPVFHRLMREFRTFSSRSFFMQSTRIGNLPLQSMPFSAAEIAIYQPILIMPNTWWPSFCPTTTTAKASQKSIQSDQRDFDGIDEWTWWRNESCNLQHWGSVAEW